MNKMMLCPKISVIMAVKDGGKYLQQAVDSVLLQTFDDFEFIIIDDCSTDDSMKIIEGYRDSRIVFTRNLSQLGLTRSLNIGLDMVRGEYIARMDADDVCLPRRFEDQARFLDHHDNIAVLGTGVRLIDGQGNTIRDVLFPTTHDLIKWHLSFYNPIAHPSVMMRKAAVMHVGGYDPALTRSQDRDLWWRLGAQYELANLGNVYVFLRQHAGQITNMYQSEQILSGVKISSNYISGLLGTSIPEKLFERLRSQDNSSSDESVAIAEFIFNYLDLFKKDLKSNASRRIITQDAVSRILFFILPHIVKKEIWPLVLKAIYTDPIKSFRMIKTFIWQSR